jgi:HEAT repeat protein
MSAVPLFIAFAATFAVWAGVSAFVVVNRMLFDRRDRRLIEIARALADPAVASLAPMDRSPAIRRILSRLSRRAVYRMVASTVLPVSVTEICAAFTIERWGLPQMILDAEGQRRPRKWRRISALFALGHIRAAGSHDLLALALFDPDRDVAGAAAVILHRLGDDRAAVILVSALRVGSLPPSRVATHLDQFPIPIHALLRPLLSDPKNGTRYWAASLLSRYPDVDGLAGEIALLVDDGDPQVRKAALATLGGMKSTATLPFVLRGVRDPVPYVRSTALRSLARYGMLDNETSRRRTFAAAIAPLLADAVWEVRLAAKESLVDLGPMTWREAAAQLESVDAFARNGAAEVLQNLGLLDRTIGVIESGTKPDADVLDMLARALHEGGQAMVDAADARSSPRGSPGIEALLTSLPVVGVAP